MISIMVIAAMAVTMMNGLYNAWQSLEVTMKNYRETYGIADAVITTDVTDAEAAERLLQVEGIAAAEARLTGGSQVMTAEGRLLNAHFISVNNETMTRMYRWSEAENPVGDPVMLDRWFAQYSGIEAGDRIRIRTGADEYRSFVVSALVSAPETLERSRLSRGGDFYPDYGFIFAPASLLADETERETARMMSEWDQKKQEYQEAEAEARAQLAEGESELSAAWTELEEKEAEFAGGRAEAEARLQELTSLRMQLYVSRDELSGMGVTAAEMRESLNTRLTELQDRRAAIQAREAELEERLSEAASMESQLEAARRKLDLAETKAASGKRELQSGLEGLKSIRDLWNTVSGARAQLKEGELLAPELQAIAERVENDLRGKGISAEDLNRMISETETTLSQAEAGYGTLISTLWKVNHQYIPQAAEYRRQLTDGLEQLRAVRETVDSVIAWMEERLTTTENFEESLPGGLEDLNGYIQETEDGIRIIREELDAAEAQLREGRELLEEKTGELEEEKRKAEAQLTEGAEKLEQAKADLDSWEGYTLLRNEFLIWFDAEVQERSEVLRAAAETFNVPVHTAVLYEDSGVETAIRNSTEPMQVMGTVVPLLFTGIMMAVLFLFLTIMIRRSRREIGIFRALGFSRGEICAAFSMANLIVMLVASGIGCVLAMVMTWLFNRVYQQLFVLPFYTHVFSGSIFLQSVLAHVALGQAATVTSMGMITRIHPAEAMNRNAPETIRIGRFSRLLLRHVRPMSKYSLLSLRRNPVRFLTSVLCIVGAVSMIFASFSFIVSKNEVLVDVFERRLRYDAQVCFNRPPEAEVAEILRGMDCVESMEPVQQDEVEIASGDRHLAGTVMYLAPDSDMVMLVDRQGQPVSLPEDGVVLSSYFAETLGVVPGDTVSIAGVDVRVAEVCRQMAVDMQYLPVGMAGKIREPMYSGWLIRLREGGDREEIPLGLQNTDGYAVTIWTDIMKKGIEDVYIQFDLYAWILVGICAVVGLFIMTNTTRNNLLEQRQSLSTLRAIGFQHGNISAHWLLQSMLFTACALGLGYPAGVMMAGVTLKYMSNAGRHLIYISSPYQFVLTAVCTLVFMLIGHVLSMRSFKQFQIRV